MAIAFTAICAVGVLIVLWIKHTRDQHEMGQHCIAPEALHALLSSHQEVLVYDVRLPLDLLADSEIIPGAKWVDPRELRQNPALIPKDKDSVVYCTCSGEKTARAILRRALRMGFLRVKFLRGGLEAWKASGYPVEPYEKPFHLDSATTSHLTVGS